MVLIASDRFCRPTLGQVIDGACIPHGLSAGCLFEQDNPMTRISGQSRVHGYSVVRRTREIGIRMALGAPRSQVLAIMLRQSMALAVAGIVLGGAGSAALTRFLESVLFGIKPFDWATLLSVIVLFLVVAGLAAYAPARRATKVDPVEALRCE